MQIIHSVGGNYYSSYYYYFHVKDRPVRQWIRPWWGSPSSSAQAVGCRGAQWGAVGPRSQACLGPFSPPSAGSLLIRGAWQQLLGLGQKLLLESWPVWGGSY